MSGVHYRMSGDLEGKARKVTRHLLFTVMQEPQSIYPT